MFGGDGRCKSGDRGGCRGGRGGGSAHVGGAVGGGGVSVVKLANGVGMSVGVGGAGNRGNAIASGRDVGEDSGVG